MLASAVRLNVLPTRVQTPAPSCASSPSAQHSEAIIFILEYLSTGNKLQLLSLGFTYLLPHQGVHLNEEK